MEVSDATEHSSVTVQNDTWKALLLLNKILRKQPAFILVSEFWRMQQIELSHVSTPQIHVLSQIIRFNALRIAAMCKYS